ncbi:MAG: hypothetical protein WCB11_22400 [Terriglobales bacterium]
MPIHDLAVAYQTKTDEELLQLVGSPEQLTPEAQAALKSELAKRRIDSAAQLNTDEENDQTKLSQPSTSGTQLLRESQSVGEFVEEVLRVYHGHFWLFVKLIAPAVIVAYVAVVMSRNEGDEIARRLPRGFGFAGHITEILEIWFTYFVGYLVTWMAFCFSFGAICSAVGQMCGQIAAGVVPSASDCFAEVRGRVGSFLRLSILLFSLALVAVAAAGLLDASVFWIFHQRQVHPSFFIMRVVLFVFAGLMLLVLSRFGLALPALILDDCRVGQAMFRSDELTDGKWLTLAILLAKSLVGGYVAGMFPFWLAGWIWAYVQLPLRVLTVASIAGVIVVEPFMFIGFALLYIKMTAVSSASNMGLASQLT